MGMPVSGPILIAKNAQRSFLGCQEKICQFKAVKYEWFHTVIYDATYNININVDVTIDDVLWCFYVLQSWII